MVFILILKYLKKFIAIFLFLNSTLLLTKSFTLYLKPKQEQRHLSKNTNKKYLTRHYNFQSFRY